MNSISISFEVELLLLRNRIGSGCGRGKVKAKGHPDRCGHPSGVHVLTYFARIHRFSGCFTPLFRPAGISLCDAFCGLFYRNGKNPAFFLPILAFSRGNPHLGCER
jgi:hypothetical protein